MPKKTPIITILQLYPNELNVYGDNGNVLCLKKRLTWRGFKCRIINHNIGDDFAKVKPDIIVGGGGQDSNQAKIADDFAKITPQLRKFTESGVPILLVCGSYQLFGQYFLTETGEKIAGAKILNLMTKAVKARLIGNLIAESDQFGQIIGYENHSGQTFLDKKLRPLGNVIKGSGNNLNDQTEGARYKNLIGTYLHGPILPKNPQIADFLIAQALKNRGLKSRLQPLDDSLERLARQQAMNRPR